jgi:PBP1b-binding outer membrane lipoprotein LpoB
VRVLALVSVLVLISACVSQERKVHSYENQVLLEVSETLSPDVEVIIATPVDGVYVTLRSQTL